jgi:toxin-antitoxin system PIN domain toxin
MIAIDTNLLIYAHRSRVREHRLAQRAIQKACDDPRGWGISAASIGEFWSIVTHPAVKGRPSKPREAADFLGALIETGHMQVWLPGSGFAERLTQLACDLDVSGVRVFDLQIALIAFENGAAELWTHDANFVRVPGLRIVDPM